MSTVKKVSVGLVGCVFLVSLIAGPVFAGGKGGKGKWKKKEYKEWVKEKDQHKMDWRDDIRYSQSSPSDCNLPPGLAKKGKVPPGWAKKCNQHAYKSTSHTHHGDHSGHYPEHDSRKYPRQNKEPKVEGEVNIGVDVHIPFP